MNHELIGSWLKLPPGPWPPAPHTLLDLPSEEADLHKIETHAQERLGRLRPYQLTHPEEVTEAMTRLAQAFVCLTERKAGRPSDVSLRPPRGRPPRRARPPVRQRNPAVVVAPVPAAQPRLPAGLTMHEESADDWPPPHHLRSAVVVWLTILVTLAGLTLALLRLGAAAARELTANPETPSPSPAGETVRATRHPAQPPAALTSVAFAHDGTDRSLRPQEWPGWIRETSAEPSTDTRSPSPVADGASVMPTSEDAGLQPVLRLCDLETGREIRRFVGHRARVNRVAISADGRYALSGSDDKTMRLWDVESGRELRCFRGASGSVHGVAFCPDGRRAASGSGTLERDPATGQLRAIDCAVRLWDLQSGKELRRLEARMPAGTRRPIWSVAFSPDGRLLLAASDPMGLWDVEAGTLRGAFFDILNLPCVVLSRDGHKAIACLDHRVVRCWDARTGSFLGHFEGPTDHVETVALSPDGRRVLSAGVDRIPPPLKGKRGPNSIQN